MELTQTFLLCIFLLLMLLLILILLLIFFKPWRFLRSSSSSSRIRPTPPLLAGEDLERLLVSDESRVLQDQSNDLERNYDVEGLFNGPRNNHGLVYKQKLPHSAPTAFQGENVFAGGSVVVEVAPDISEDILVSQMPKWQRQPVLTSEKVNLSRNKDTGISVEGNNTFHYIGVKDISTLGSCLTLEVISGPALGRRHTVTNTSKLPLTLGRVSPTELSLLDSEVSGKHAMINWNLNKNKWELIDMGSLNGTLLNQMAIHHPNSGSRQWGDPVDIANGDIITLGTSSKISVKIDSQKECKPPFGIGMVSDPMAVRRGGRKLPMEDVCYYQWPIASTDQFGLFGICDGHGGAAAAKSVSKILPEKVADLLSDFQRRERVVSLQDASDVLKDAFSYTEANLNHHYEGCTSTALLVWMDDGENIFAQCGNVGDSACVIIVDGNLIMMSEDHRVTSLTERERIKQIGEAIKDGEKRLCGLNLARMLGDKFLKEQDARFSSEPYISQVVSIDRGSRIFALLASDGFWDVIGAKKATQLVAQAKEKSSRDGDTSAEKIANILLNEARKLRTKDNTSLIFLDFSIFRDSL